ncbi:hypothetical protein INT44_002511 [Umbelopsis vinacea]|uniref:Pentapeptide repeat-containing protein n=1 Tax=Umbelopsis vinacea TaxID=44442 RepID=A0A8H7PDE8_9FUNG|nr:hypothetical protein INT44_002511 [Umbelopsis vinacea]
MKIEIKHVLTGVVLFAHTADVNSIAITVKTAVAQSANLYGANLYGANLYGANLYGANLYGANLYGANLRGADLYGADLRGADLGGADLRGADLRGADLRGADLRGADLRGANTDQVKNLTFTIVPEEGAFVGWKKLSGGVVAKLEIPADAKRTSTTRSRKNRAEFVRVLEVFGATEGVSMRDHKTVYRAGEIVRPDSYNGDFREECTNGIHFFITRAEAEAY